MFDFFLSRLLDPVVEAVLSELPDEVASAGRRAWSQEAVRVAAGVAAGALLAAAARRVDSGLGDLVDDVRGSSGGGAQSDEPRLLA